MKSLIAKWSAPKLFKFITILPRLAISLLNSGNSSLSFISTLVFFFASLFFNFNQGNLKFPLYFSASPYTISVRNSFEENLFNNLAVKSYSLGKSYLVISYRISFLTEFDFVFKSLLSFEAKMCKAFTTSSLLS